MENNIKSVLRIIARLICKNLCKAQEIADLRIIFTPVLYYDSDTLFHKKHFVLKLWCYLVLKLFLLTEELKDKNTEILH